MTVYNLKTQQKLLSPRQENGGDGERVIFCSINEVESLREIYKWDEGAAPGWAQQDEPVRYANYDGYDFINLAHADIDNDQVVLREVSIFFAAGYLVIVLPEDEGERIPKLVRKLIGAVESESVRALPMLYYSALSGFASDYSETLEILEDELEELAEAIPLSSASDDLLQIGKLRKRAYAFKKLMRSVSYIGGQILMDENHLLSKSYMNHFRNINTRLLKLHDLADSLYSLSGELLHTYDSRSSARLNETMNKLTIITLFFAPLTVITGIYGMNFQNMPELGWTFGYPAAIGMMAFVSLMIFIMMKLKKWL